MIFSNDINSYPKKFDKEDDNHGSTHNADNILKIDKEHSEYYNYNQIWLKKIFKRYYFNFFSNIILPEKINLREFGFRQFDGKINRHISFSNSGELYAYVLKFPPSDIYCSSSFYRHPDEGMMDKKEWLGSELIFDIDGKDLNLECVLEHNYTKCHTCGNINKGILKSCSNCNSSRLLIIDVPCKHCIFFLKEEVKKLKKLLIEDFGINGKTISIYFSGNNGFHLHVNDENYYNLLSSERSEIASYLMGKGFKIDTLGIRIDNEKKNAIILKSKRLLAIGWRGRIFKYLKINFSAIKNKDAIVKLIENLENSWKCTFQQIISKAVEDLAVKLDPVVTMDVHRIFRLNGTLNSKSGLAKIHCSDLDSFDPFKDACFYDKTEVQIDSKVNTTINFKRRKYELNNGLITVPEYLATYLISKGLANINLKEIE